MLGWIKRVFGASGAMPAVSAVNPGGSQPALKTAPAKAATTDEAAALPVATIGTVSPAAAPREERMSPRRSAFRSDLRWAKPAIGTPARIIAPGKAVEVTIMAVQSGGRRILAKQNEGRMVQAFTLRPDRTYRLAGASDVSHTQLLIE